MHRRTTTGWAGLALLATAISGCDGFTSRPGPPPAAAVVEATKIAVILPASGLAELDIWEATARRQEQRTKTLVEVFRTAPGDPPEGQADLIRRAIAEGATALIVMADDPRAVVRPLEEARELGLPVVLLDRAVPLSGPPAPLVTYTPDEEVAKALVDAATADAKAAGFPPEGPAILLVSARAEAHMLGRVKALRDELEARGVRVLPDVTYSGLIEEARAALKEAYLTAPHVAMVFCEDDFALKGTAGFRHALDRTQRRFVMAGFSHERKTRELVEYNLAAAIVDRNLNEPIRRAFDTALTMLKGETVPEVVVAPTPVTRASGKEQEGVAPAFLTMPAAMSQMLKDQDQSMPVQGDPDAP